MVPLQLAWCHYSWRGATTAGVVPLQLAWCHYSEGVPPSRQGTCSTHKPGTVETPPQRPAGGSKGALNANTPPPPNTHHTVLGHNHLPQPPGHSTVQLRTALDRCADGVGRSRASKSSQGPLPAPAQTLLDSTPRRRSGWRHCHRMTLPGWTMSPRNTRSLGTPRRDVGHVGRKLCAW